MHRVEHCGLNLPSREAAGRQLSVVPPTPVTARPPLHTWAAATVLFAGTVLLFSRSLGYDFVNYDDPGYVTNNAHVQAGLTWDSIVWAFTGKSDYWHPLTWLSHMLDWQLFGENAAGHRLVSVLWHATNAVLVGHVMHRLTRAWWTSLFSAALFAWHPLRVESVVWITERKDVMSGFFFLVTLWAYAGYAERMKAGSRAGGHYALTLGLFAGGLMCKPMLVTVPVVLLILDVWPLGRFTSTQAAGWWRRHRCVVMEKLPFFILSGVTSVVTVVMQHHSGAFTLEVSIGARLGNAVVSVARYLGNFFWPVDLSVCYAHPGEWPALVVAGAFALGTGISALAWRQRAARPWLGAGWLWFLVMLLPTIGLIQVGFQAMADRYTYLPILGWQLALLWTLRERPMPRALRAGLATAALAACLLGTWRQQGFWRDSITLFQHAVDLDEENNFAHGFLSFTHFNLGHLDEAARHAEQALQLESHNQTALFTLASVRERQGRFAPAAESLQRILQLNPSHAQARYLRSVMLLRLGQRSEALAELRIAVQLSPEFQQSNLELAFAELRHGQPRHALPHFELALELDHQDVTARHGYATALTLLGRSGEAQEQFEATLRLQPNHPNAHIRLGLILLSRHQSGEAADHFRAALLIQPDDPMALAALGQAEEQLGHPDLATGYFAQAIRLAPRDVEIHRAWAEILMRRGEYDEAAQAFTQLLSIWPDDAEGHASLGYALIMGGHRTEAIPHWEKALRLKPDFPGLRERLQRIRH